MIVTDVREEIVTLLQQNVDRIHAYSWTNGLATPPAALVMLPTQIQYDQTYGRGLDRMEIDVVVIVGRADDRSAFDLLSSYMDGSGNASVKAALESGDNDAWSTVRVTTVVSGTTTVGGTDYLAATFTLDITGPGS